MVLGYCILVVLTNKYSTVPGYSLTNISKCYTKKTPCILNTVAPYLSMKVVTTRMSCRASDISAHVVFYFTAFSCTHMYCMLHECIGCYTHAHACYYAMHVCVFAVCMSHACHTRVTRVGRLSCRWSVPYIMPRHATSHYYIVVYFPKVQIFPNFTNGLTTQESLFWAVTWRLIVGLAITEIGTDAIMSRWLTNI